MTSRRTKVAIASWVVVVIVLIAIAIGQGQLKRIDGVKSGGDALNATPWPSQPHSRPP